MIWEIANGSSSCERIFPYKSIFFEKDLHFKLTLSTRGKIV